MKPVSLPRRSAHSARTTKKRNSSRSLDYQACEPRQLLATLADAGISQRAIDLINNQGEFAGEFRGDIGENSNSTPDVVYTDLVLNDVAFQNTINAIAGSQTVPAGATLITTKSQLLNNITSGSVANPNVYHVLGDFTLNSSEVEALDETIEVPSNVEIYVEGSIFKEGVFTAISQFNNGSGEAENSESLIFHLQGSDNVKLVGIDNAKIHSNPTLVTTSPHATGIRIEGSATNVMVDGFEMDFLWQGVDASFGTREITVQNNFIQNSVKRAIWFLGTSNSTAVHNFTFNSMVDGIDFDAFTADSVAYENVLVSSGRFAFFVEEGANNNFSVRNMSIVFRVDGPFFNLGNVSNGTSNFFAGNNFYNGDFDEYTRDNFFLDNSTFFPSTRRQNAGADYFAQGDNGVAGNHYFYGNRGFGAGRASEGPGNRNLAFKFIYEDKLPSGVITTANDIRFDNPDGFHSYDLVERLNTLDATYNAVQTPIRAEILPEAAEEVLYQESNGRVVIEAETFSDRVAGTGSATGRFWNLLIDDDFGGSEPATEAASGDFGLIAQRNSDVNLGTDLNGARVDYEVLFQTPGTYNVFIRTRVGTLGDQQIQQQLGSNSVQLGLDGASFTNSGGFGVGNDSELWSWTGSVVGGVQQMTIEVTEPGRQTLNVWMREDGVEIDKIVLEVAGTIPTGFGPDQSPTLFNGPPTIAAFNRDGSPIDQVQALARPDQLSDVTVQFSKAVAVQSNNFLLRNDATDSFIDTQDVQFSYSGATTTATWDFSNLSNPLEPSFYTFFLVGGSVLGNDGSGNLDGDGDGIGGDLVERSIYVALPGDADYNGEVDVLGDAAILVDNLGTTSGATWSSGDFNGDGSVDVLGDAAILVENLGRSVWVTASANAVTDPAAMLAFTSDDTSRNEQAVADVHAVNKAPELTLAGAAEMDDAFATEWFL